MLRFKRNAIIVITILNIMVLGLNIILFSSNNTHKANVIKNSTAKETSNGNNPYKMYYGKWKINKIVSFDSRCGVSESSKKLIGKTIEYSGNYIKINNIVKLNNPVYDTIMAPIKPNFRLVEDLSSLGELGIQGKYFDCVHVYNFYEVKGDYFGANFCVKDDTTLIMYENNVYFELKRISHIDDNPTVAFPG